MDGVGEREIGTGTAWLLRRETTQVLWVAARMFRSLLVDLVPSGPLLSEGHDSAAFSRFGEERTSAWNDCDMDYWVEVADDEVHELAVDRLKRLRSHGPVLRTSGSTLGKPEASVDALVDSVAGLEPAALWFTHESTLVSAEALLPVASSLRSLEVGWRLSDPASLACFDKLSELYVARWNFEDVRGLSDVPYLERLTLCEAHTLEDLSGMPSSISYLNITFGSKLIDLRPLAACTNLKALILDPVNRLVDLTPIRDMPQLRWLAVEGKALNDPSPLHGHPGIEVLMWYGKRVAMMPEVVASMKSIKQFTGPTTAREDREWRPQDEKALQQFNTLRA